MIELDKTKAYERSYLEEVLKEGTALIDSSLEASLDIYNEFIKMRRLTNYFAVDARDEEFISTISYQRELPTEVQLDAKGWIEQIIKRLMDEVPMHDRRHSEMMESNGKAADRCIQSIRQLRELISTGKHGTAKEFQKQYKTCSRSLKKASDQTRKDQMALTALTYGMKTYSSSYSKDPVNLCTGNFYYEKTDLRMWDSTLLCHRRSYNAMSDRSGPLGRGWSHSYDRYRS